MIIPFPVRIPVLIAFLFACVLVLVQLLEGTDPRYSGLVFCFIMLSVFAFNVAGGFSRPSGGYIFFYSVLVVLVGTIYKALLGEPAQTHLQQPILLMSLYVASIAGMLLAAFISRRIATTVDGIAGVLHIRSFNYQESALGCLVLFGFLTFGGLILPANGGQILHSLQIINPFLPLTILLGTISAVQLSRGMRSTSALTWFAMGYIFVTGLLSFSKQGVFTPVVCWVIGVAWARFRLRFVHLAFLGIFAVLSFKLFVPICQIGRNAIQVDTLDERVRVVEDFLFHPSTLRKIEDEYEIPVDLDMRMYYYNQPQGFMDRLSMMPNDSVLIQWTDQGHVFGYLAIRYYFENWVPHIIDPHKLEGIAVGGNTYVHEMGGLADADTTTGISFSPTAEAFHIDGWRGILLLAPPIWMLLFITTDATVGDIRRQPLGMLTLLTFAHVAPEGLLGGAIELVRLLNLAIAVAVFACGYIAPVLGMLLRGRPTFRDERPMHGRHRGGLTGEALEGS